MRLATRGPSDRRRARKAVASQAGMDAYDALPSGASSVIIGAFRRRTLRGSSPPLARELGERGVRVGFSAGQLSTDPRLALSFMLRRALRPRPPLAPVILYDAAGNRIGTMDPVTRVRTLRD